MADNAVTPIRFDLATIEGDGTTSVRICNLLNYVRAHQRVSGDHERSIRASPAAQRRFKKANRGGGRLLRFLRDRDHAVGEELRRREAQGELSPEATPDVPNVVDNSITDGDPNDNKTATSTAVDNSTAVPSSRVLYPASFADDLARIDREMAAEEAGVRKPNRNDRLVAARLAAYQRGDMGIVQSLDNQQERRRDAKKRARQRKKGRKAELRAYIADRVNRDPNSNND